MAKQPVNGSQPVTDTLDVSGRPNSDGPTVGGLLDIGLGLLFNVVFFTFAWAVPLAFVERYFLGHPIAMAETAIFLIGLAILAVKAKRVHEQLLLTRGIRDCDLTPAVDTELSESERWVVRNDAGRAARGWLAALEQLPTSARNSPLVLRLNELLSRQASRASTRHLADDQRELSARDLDAAHDSFALVRIIVWAIPMLGFLGTVIGITQTLGGLDFTKGPEAVDQLKTGLYVAFDTTAIGLVFSVGAIFLQFPIERAEQRMLAEIDQRVGTLLSTYLPSDDHVENPAAQISLLCDGIRVAVGQSLASQTDLWRQTIDEARQHWRGLADDNGRRLSQSLLETLAPVLQIHSHAFDEHASALREHADALADVEKQWGSEFGERWNRWNDVVAKRCDQLTEDAQASQRLADGLSGAMLTLARAVDALSRHLPPSAQAALAADLAQALPASRSIDPLTEPAAETTPSTVTRPKPIRRRAA
ncbi:MAG: MotA/TolQ/ExbB proton channel family protein [Planctomycetaceae bacterium]|nr:MAG: MotA/TolQ/ExbB proton channel family protein [Planctomycetaceae bacterium]